MIKYKCCGRPSVLVENKDVPFYLRLSEWFYRLSVFPKKFGWGLQDKRRKWWFRTVNRVSKPIVQLFSPKIVGERILVPTFEVASNPTIRLSDVKSRRFYIIDRSQIRAKEKMQRQEDALCFDSLAYHNIVMHLNYRREAIVNGKIVRPFAEYKVGDEVICEKGGRFYGPSKIISDWMGKHFVKGCGIVDRIHGKVIDEYIREDS